MKRYQIGSAVSLLLFGAIICWEARQLDMGRIVKPGPGFFPFWLGFALVIVSVALIIQFRRAKAEGPAQGLWKELCWEKILYTLGALLLYAFFLESLGYILATFLLLFFLLRVIDAQRWWVVIFGSVVTSFITFALFKVWLQVQLPVGLWGM
jgi:putative tricarboxylic transport membrane protein